MFGFLIFIKNKALIYIINKYHTKKHQDFNKLLNPIYLT